MPLGRLQKINEKTNSDGKMMQAYFRDTGGRQSAFTLAIILIIGACLILLSLGDRALWDDEAQTAVLGRQVLLHGLPAMEPGDNFPTDRPHRDDFNKQGVFTWNTWLPHYLVAASFAVFGESEFAARLPFALAGILTILLTVSVARRFYPREPWYPVLAALILVLSVPFLLHVRQCRYYAIVILGTLWMVYGYIGREGEKGRRPDWRHIAAGGILCFYSFYIIAAINGIALLLHALWCRNRQALRGLAIAGVIILVVAAPAVIYMRLWALPPNPRPESVTITNSFWVYMLWLNGFVVPLPLVLLAGYLQQSRGFKFIVAAYILFLAGAAVLSPLASSAIALVILVLGVIAFRLARGQPRMSSGKNQVDSTSWVKPGELLVFFTITYIFFWSVFSQFPFYRYVIPLVPLAALFMARITGDLLARSFVSGIALLAILVTSNALSAFPLAALEQLVGRDEEPPYSFSPLPREPWRWTAIRSDLTSYLGELRSPPIDPERCIANMVKARNNPGEVIKVSYGDISLMYYAPDMRIISRHIVGEKIPDIVISRPPYPLNQNDASLQRLRGIPYVTEKLPCPNIVWSNSPDPLFHRYEPPADVGQLVIIRRQEN